MNDIQLLKKYKTEIKAKLKVYNKKIEDYERIQTILRRAIIGGMASITLAFILPYDSNNVDVHEYLRLGTVSFTLLSLFSFSFHTAYYFPTSKRIDSLEIRIRTIQSKINRENQEKEQIKVAKSVSKR